MKITGIELRTVQTHEDAEKKDDRYVEFLDDIDQMDIELPVEYAIYLRVQLDERHNEARWMFDYGTAREARWAAADLREQLSAFKLLPIDDLIVEEEEGQHGPDNHH